MNYIIVDLEFNQSFNFKTGNKAKANPRLPMEIIQIGAVKLSSDLKVIDKFGTLVKPMLYCSLNPFVAKVTGLDKDALSSARPFDVVYPSFLNFIGKKPAALCFWGRDDMRELVRNVLFNEQNYNCLPMDYINVQRMASLFLELPAKQQQKLSDVVSRLNIEAPLPFHNAVNDAFYTALVFERIFNPEHLNTQTYDLENFIIQYNEIEMRAAK